MAAGRLAALAAPAVMWGEFVYWGSATPGYNVLLRAASDLGMVGAGNRLAFTAGFFYAGGALTVGLAVALWRLLPRGTASSATALLVCLEGVALAGAGVVPENPASSDQTALHQAVASVSYFSAAVAPILMGAAVHRRLRRLSRITTAFGVVLLGLLGVATICRAIAPLPDGVFQRPFGVVLTAWFLLTAIALGHLPARGCANG